MASMAFRHDSHARRHILHTQAAAGRRQPRHDLRRHDNARHRNTDYGASQSSPIIWLQQILDAQRLLSPYTLMPPGCSRDKMIITPIALRICYLRKILSFHTLER